MIKDVEILSLENIVETSEWLYDGDDLLFIED